jgi:uncharacterized membrane protein required for colicin V production
LYGQQYEATAQKMFEMMYDMRVSAASLYISVVVGLTFLWKKNNYGAEN